jgi:hypothetical protein
MLTLLFNHQNQTLITLHRQTPAISTTVLITDLMIPMMPRGLKLLHGSIIVIVIIEDAIIIFRT